MALELFTVQVKIASTGAWVACPALPAYSHNFPSITIRAKTGNTAAIAFCSSNAGSVATDGTGTGFILDAGAQITVNTINLNSLFYAGTSADAWSAIGN